MLRKALIAITALAATSAAAAERPPLLCGGVEPFWSLELGAEAALWSAPDSASLNYEVRDERKAEGRPWPKVLTLLAQQDTAVVLLRPAACSDTMSDTTFEWTVDVLTQRRSTPVVYTGCCRLAPE